MSETPGEIPQIAHLDADAFFASVEIARDPSLRGRPMAVGGQPRGIIASASYEARAKGVYTPMPTSRALQVCPELILKPGDFELYRTVSRQVFLLCADLTPLVERRSIDEGFFDLTPVGLQSTAAAEAKICGFKDRVRRELGITVSVGLAANKLVAAIASKLRKPDGFVIVAPGTEAAFLADLSIGRLPGIGPKTEATLNASGLRKIGDIQRLCAREREAIFGSRAPDMLRLALGEDDEAVSTESEDAKSYSVQETFAEDIRDRAKIVMELKKMIDELAVKLRADGKRARTITIRIRYPGMEDQSAGRTLDQASDLETDFYSQVEPLLQSAWRQRRPLRLVSVRLSSLEGPPAQMELFGERDARRRRLAAAIDRLNRSKGAGTVRRGYRLDDQA